MISKLNSILKEFRALPQDKKEIYLERARKNQIIFEVGNVRNMALKNCRSMYALISPPPPLTSLVVFQASPPKAPKSKKKASQTDKRERDEEENTKDSKPPAKRRRIQKNPRLRKTQQSESKDGDSKQITDDASDAEKSVDNPPKGEKNDSKAKAKKPKALSGSSAKSTSSKKSRDPNAPSRMIRANEFYLRKQSKAAREEYPELKSMAIRKLVFDRFKKLSPEEKKEYEDLAAKDKERYNREMEEYNKMSTAIV